MKFSQFLESTIEQLYNQTVSGFPRTGKRQHSVQPIKITEMNWTPFLGTKTLLVRGTAESGEKVYNTVVLFKDVVYGSGIPLVATDGRLYHLEQLMVDKNDVLVRCNCDDYRWRFQHWNHVDRSLYGADRKPYEGTGTGLKANPDEVAGFCKHIIRTLTAIRDSNILV